MADWIFCAGYAMITPVAYSTWERAARVIEVISILSAMRKRRFVSWMCTRSSAG